LQLTLKAFLDYLVFKHHITDYIVKNESRAEFGQRSKSGQLSMFVGMACGFLDNRNRHQPSHA